MLKKLLKHEFRATARTYGGLYLALLAVSVLFGASIRGWNGTNSDAYSTAVGLLSLAYTAVLIGTAVVTVMTIVRRFYSNLLGREGYLMHTLPVTEAQLVGAKLISGTVWSVCSIFAAGLSFGILAILMMAEIDLLDQLPWMLSQLREAFARYDMAFWEAMLFSGLVCFVRMVSAIACIYAACMVGLEPVPHQPDRQPEPEHPERCRDAQREGRAAHEALRREGGLDAASITNDGIEGRLIDSGTHTQQLFDPALNVLHPEKAQDARQRRVALELNME